LTGFAELFQVCYYSVIEVGMDIASYASVSVFCYQTDFCLLVWPSLFFHNMNDLDVELESALSKLADDTKLG